MFKSQIVFAALITIFVSSCGSETKPASSNPSPATNDKKPTTNDAVKPSRAFVSTQATSTAINEGSRMTSLAAKAKATGKPYTVFQYSGVTCESCKVDSPKVQADLSRMSHVARVVIFPNQVGEYKESEYKGFLDSYAPGAERMVDGNLAVLKQIRKDKTQFFGLYVVVRASDGAAVILNDTNAHLQIADFANELN